MRFPSALILAQTDCGGASARAVSERGGRQGALAIQVVEFLNLVVLLPGIFASRVATKKAVEYTQAVSERGVVHAGLCT